MVCVECSMMDGMGTDVVACVRACVRGWVAGVGMRVCPVMFGWCEFYSFYFIQSNSIMICFD